METTALRFTAKVRQKLFDFLLAHFLGIPLALKQNVVLDPVDISMFGTNAVILKQNFVMNLIK